MAQSVNRAVLFGWGEPQFLACSVTHHKWGGKPAVDLARHFQPIMLLVDQLHIALDVQTVAVVQIGIAG